METYCHGNKISSRSKKYEELRREVYLEKMKEGKISFKFNSFIIVFAKSAFTFGPFHSICEGNIYTYIFLTGT